MSDETLTQVKNDAGNTDSIAYLQEFAAVKKAHESPADPFEYCTVHTIKVNGYQPGCFP